MNMSVLHTLFFTTLRELRRREASIKEERSEHFIPGSLMQLSDPSLH